ncbi:MAG TPA: bifunctional adenosylcobinamide kinase/adenosylcobinamide-phosphate guanylyltransferase [Candidatus Binataceae bacterium]|nr:bifunctional adenosylcobinamide kinase/adenosylcobinamide-phosphate guanylyltransferase [Candidatus Binataceae bacterium]
MKKITLITGGARSGKSAHALKLANSYPGEHKVFIATAEALDDEMRERIAHHRRGRPAAYRTIEEPRQIKAALGSLVGGHADIVIVDCLTIWVSNVMHAHAADGARALIEELVAKLSELPFAIVFVTDEVGSGIVPDNPLSREFRDLLGRTNQAVAAAADEVIMMVAGIPLRVK